MKMRCGNCWTIRCRAIKYAGRWQPSNKSRGRASGRRRWVLGVAIPAVVAVIVIVVMNRAKAPRPTRAAGPDCAPGCASRPRRIATCTALQLKATAACGQSQSRVAFAEPPGAAPRAPESARRRAQARRM